MTSGIMVTMKLNESTVPLIVIETSGFNDTEGIQHT